MSEDDRAPPQQESVTPRGRWWHSLQAVAWALLGVRKSSGFERDFARLTPMHVIAVGLVAVFVLVVGLIVLVNWVTG